MALAASSLHREKLGQSLKSIIHQEPSALTMQSPPYTLIPTAELSVSTCF